MKKVVGLLIGNKCDGERKVKEEDAKKFAEEHELKYLETSVNWIKISEKQLLAF